MERISLYSLQSDYQSKLYNSGKWIDGACMKELEERLKSYLGVKYIVLTNSGTSSLFAAYWALKDRFSSIVTCPYTWPATYQAARVLNYTAHFKKAVLTDTCEFSSKDLNVLVHLFGQPRRMIDQLSGKPFIEDAAQAFGAEIQGKKVGTFGMLGCYSFYPTKTFHTNGHGGAISTDDEDLYRSMKMFVECGRWDGKVTDTIALNLRLDELHAEFLLFELEHYDERMETQRQMARELKSVIPTPQPFLEEHPGDRHVYSVFNLLLDRRDDFRAFMNDRGVDTMVYYNNDILPAPERDKYRAVTERVCSVPCRWNLSDSEFRRISEALRAWFGENTSH